jgi:hypothetical protein
MSDSATIIRDGDETHQIRFSHRDWMLLWGPGFLEGPAFSNTVAGGIPKGSLVQRDGNTLHAAASNLLGAIKRDYDLLRYDYSYKVADKPKRYGGGQGIVVNGRTGVLSLRPKGYCSIEIIDSRVTPPRIAEVIDLRGKESFETDSGNLKVYPRKAETHWLEILPPLMALLSTRLKRTLVLEHIDRVG